MKSFINPAIVTASKSLKAGHYPFSRKEVLFEAVSRCVTDYFVRASIGKPFEARGVLVIGESRQGKTKEIRNILEKFNSSGEIMPDGRPAKIIQRTLSGKVTWKTLGELVLKALGYPLKGRHTQAQIWELVIKTAKLQGVVGIHFDECQHVFKEGAVSNQQFLDSFKTLLKDTRWPLMLILSGVPELEKQISKEEQLYRLLSKVEFQGIDLNRQSDMDELVDLAFSFARRAGVEFSVSEGSDFFERFAFAACNRWGLAIELLIEALTICQLAGEKVSTVEHFSQAFSTIYSTPPGYTPFDLSDYQDGFDHEKLLAVLENSDD